MKIINILILLSLITHCAYAQKISVNEIDKFTKQHRLETKNERLVSSFSTNLLMRLRAVDSTCFIILYGTGKGTEVIGKGDIVMFLLSNDSTVKAYSTGLQDYDISQGSFGVDKKYEHQYSIGLSDLKVIANAKLKSVRKYATDSYSDIDIPERNQDKLAKLCELFLKNL